MAQTQSYQTKGGGIITTSSPRLQASLQAQGAKPVPTPSSVKTSSISSSGYRTYQTSGGGTITTSSPRLQQSLELQGVKDLTDTPKYTPSGGVGSRTTVGNTVYEYTSSGWTPIASSAQNTTIPKPTEPPKPERDVKYLLPTPIDKPPITYRDENQETVGFSAEDPRVLEINRATGPLKTGLREEYGFSKRYEDSL